MKPISNKDDFNRLEPGSYIGLYSNNKFVIRKFLWAGGHAFNTKNRMYIAVQDPFSGLIDGPKSLKELRTSKNKLFGLFELSEEEVVVHVALSII